MGAWLLRLFHVDKDPSPFHEPVGDLFDSLFASNLAVAHCNKRVRKTSATDRKSDETGTLAAMVSHSITFSSLEPRPSI